MEVRLGGTRAIDTAPPVRVLAARLKPHPPTVGRAPLPGVPPAMAARGRARLSGAADATIGAANLDFAFTTAALTVFWMTDAWMWYRRTMLVRGSVDSVRLGNTQNHPSRAARGFVQPFSSTSVPGSRAFQLGALQEVDEVDPQSLFGLADLPLLPDASAVARFTESEDLILEGLVGARPGEETPAAEAGAFSADAVRGGVFLDEPRLQDRRPRVRGAVASACPGCSGLPAWALVPANTACDLSTPVAPSRWALSWGLLHRAAAGIVGCGLATSRGPVWEHAASSVMEKPCRIPPSLDRSPRQRGRPTRGACRPAFYLYDVRERQSLWSVASLCA